MNNQYHQPSSSPPHHHQELTDVRDGVTMMMNNNNNFVQSNHQHHPPQPPPPGSCCNNINNYYYYVQQHPFHPHHHPTNNNGVFAFQPVFVTIPSGHPPHHHLIPTSFSQQQQPNPSSNQSQTTTTTTPNHNLSKSISFDSDNQYHDAASTLNINNNNSHFKQKFSNEIYIDEYSLPHYAQQNSSHHSSVPYSQFSDPRLWIKPSNSFLSYPLVVTFFNFLLLGLGHTLIGQDRKGISYMLVTMIILFLCIIFFGVLILPFYWLWGLMIIKDGYKLSKRLREGIPIHQAECTNTWAIKGISQFVGADLTLFNNNNPRECSQEWLDMINHLTTI